MAEDTSLTIDAVRLQWRDSIQLLTKAEERLKELATVREVAQSTVEAAEASNELAEHTEAKIEALFKLLESLKTTQLAAVKQLNDLVEALQLTDPSAIAKEVTLLREQLEAQTVAFAEETKILREERDAAHSATKRMFSVLPSRWQKKVQYIIST